MRIRSALGSSRPGARRHERGMAVIVVIAILALLLIYLAGNVRTLHLLSRDLKQIEQKQLLRLKLPNPPTNALAVTAVSWPTNASH